MARSKVFIASSSEGLNVAEKVQSLLKQPADVRLWDRVVDLTATYIESLEKEMAQAQRVRVDCRACHQARD